MTTTDDGGAPTGQREGRVEGTRFRVEWVAETGSTNDDVLASARTGATEGLVRVADHQSAGRRRLDRRWEAPPGASLLLSVLLRPPEASVPASAVHLCTKAVALAAVEACRPVTTPSGVAVRLKWPNDLIVDTALGTRKLGGILAESIVDGGSISAVVVGLGLNVAWPTELPVELADVAIALNHLPGAEQSPQVAAREAVLQRLLLRLESLYAGLLEDGPEQLLDHYRTECATLGQQVRVELIGSMVEGRASDIDGDGHLVVVRADGSNTTVSVGDVVHLRPSIG